MESIERFDQIRGPPSDPNGQRSAFRTPDAPLHLRGMEALVDDASIWIEFEDMAQHGWVQLRRTVESAADLHAAGSSPLTLTDESIHQRGLGGAASDQRRTEI